MLRQAVHVVMKSKKPLKDRLALVTGASRGIGRAVAIALAEHGAHVVIAARTIGALEELDDEIREGGGKATLLQIDLSNGDKLDQLGPTLFTRWGKLDIFVGKEPGEPIAPDTGRRLEALGDEGFEPC